MTEASHASIKRAAGWALVAGLTIAALTAVAALLGADFDETDLRVILTSVGFAIASSAAATGAAQRFRPSAGLAALGAGTAGLSGLAFVFLVAGLWTNVDDWGSEGVWRAFGCTAVLAIAGTHACVVLGARRRSDGDQVTALVFGSLALAALDTLGAILPISGLIEDVDDSMAKLMAATLVLLVLTSVLPPILRRLRKAPVEGSNGPLERFAGEVETIAARIDELNRGPTIRAPEIRREVERLRRLARSFQG